MNQYVVWCLSSNLQNISDKFESDKFDKKSVDDSGYEDSVIKTFNILKTLQKHIEIFLVQIYF